MTYRILALCMALIVSGQAAIANERVTDKGTFLSLVDGNSLKIRLYALSLDVLPNGTIKGSALGSKVTGNWTWQDGYFCRGMMWGERDIGYNCQLVTAAADRMTFTTDKGAGDSATFRVTAR